MKRNPPRLPAYGPVVIDCYSIPWRRRAARAIRNLVQRLAAVFNR